MNAKEYLSEIKRLDRLISNLEQEMDNLRLNALVGKSPRIVADKVQSSPSGDMMAEYVEKAVDIEREVSVLLNEYRKKRWRIVKEINALPDPTHVQLLYLRYVEGRCLEDIACVMRKPNGKMYNYEYIKRLHGLALDSFAEKYLKKSPNIT